MKFSRDKEKNKNDEDEDESENDESNITRENNHIYFYSEIDRNTIFKLILIRYLLKTGTRY